MLAVHDVPYSALTTLLHRFGLELIREASDAEIRGSFWGDSEAGIIGFQVFVRDDTPIHSLLHEASHVICMSEDRRSGLDRDAGGDDLEEAAVCYLQLLLADAISDVGRRQLMCDMDDWGYSFRLGSTQSWFEHDAEDARAFLTRHGLLDGLGELTYQLRL